jgi:hypothetical protein
VFLFRPAPYDFLERTHVPPNLRSVSGKKVFVKVFPLACL